MAYSYYEQKWPANNSYKQRFILAEYSLYTKSLGSVSRFIDLPDTVFYDLAKKENKGRILAFSSGCLVKPVNIHSIFHADLPGFDMLPSKRRRLCRTGLLPFAGDAINLKFFVQAQPFSGDK